MSRLHLPTLLWTLLALTLLLLGAGLAFVLGGVYDVSATHQHRAWTFELIELTARRAVSVRARDIVVPPLDAPALIERGLVLYAVHCAQCHGGPGQAPAPFAFGMTPSPTNLAADARERPPAEMYWVIRNGLKMTAMPAWRFRLHEADHWALVAFLRTLPALTPAQWRSALAGRTLPKATAALSALPATSVPDPERGRLALQMYGCATCHEIPGVVGAHSPVGPPLARLKARALLSGNLPNSPQNLALWLRNPQAIDPDSAMPDLALSARDAQDLAAFLWTLE